MNAKQRQLRLGDYVAHMLDASRTAREYIARIDKAEFMETRMIQQAVILNLIVIGEAAVQIETEFPEFAQANAAVPWKKLRGMRNRMTHGYFDTNLDIVWETVQTALPDLERRLAQPLE
ncbi:DUF86 domain-containing protein [Caballeronia sp. LZ035]|uniref:HepT-like ribonuclease domain-containing protein n=1 Tax=Caballeronia sp. LZ035 TaxID=3038568 RepID=UPI00285D2D93|nr:DUF86 domain-containing protein [Caballeronia sp. LZ035]MDR5756061.1 DUF86 domain-containing protein [Caballeronia sp. LZ035]